MLSWYKEEWTGTKGGGGKLIMSGLRSLCG